ncbi:MAG: hypothetical protein HOO96_06165 [Polyangiaceae bacterium]|nr:hypothetical protein [Polyangiaceae bacterium]
MSSILPNVPEVLDLLVAAALEKDPAKRPESAVDFARMLQAVHDVLALAYQNERSAEPNTTERTPLSKLIVAAEKSEAREKEFRTGSLADIEASGAYAAPQMLAAAPPSAVDPVARTKQDPRRTIPMSAEGHALHGATKRAPYAPQAGVQQQPASMGPQTNPPPDSLPLRSRPNFDTQPAPRSNLLAVALATSPLISPPHAQDSVAPSMRSPHPQARPGLAAGLRRLWRERVRPPSKLEAAIAAAALLVLALGLVCIGVLLPPNHTAPSAARPAPLASGTPMPPTNAAVAASPAVTSPPEPTPSAASPAAPASASAAHSARPFASNGPKASPPSPANSHMCLKDGYILDLHRSCAEMKRDDAARKTGLPALDF